MRRSSIRVRITAIAAAVVAVVLIVAGVGLVVVQRRQLTATVDASLRQRTEDLAALLETAGAVPPELAGTHQEGFAQVVTATGIVVSSTPNLAGSPAVTFDYVPGDERLTRTLTGLALDDDEFRVLSSTVIVAGQTLALHVGTTFDVVAESTASLAPGLAVAIPLVVVLLAALVWWLVGRTLEPVEGIRAEVAAIGGADPGRRVPVPPGDDEISRLAWTMNEMLDRLETSLERQQQFTADASHELRSPLTRMRTELEVDLAAGVPPAERSRITSLLEEVVTMQELVDDLLALAAADAGRLVPATKPVDLDDIVLAEAARLRASGVDVDASAVSGAAVRGEPRQLRRAVANLADNGARHASSRVVFTLAESDGAAVLGIADDGPGIPPERAEEIFGRFSRLDQARSRAVGGSGLGLAIARDIVERHGGTIVLDLSHHPGARFLVRLPLA